MYYSTKHSKLVVELKITFIIYIRILYGIFCPEILKCSIAVNILLVLNSILWCYTMEVLLCFRLLVLWYFSSNKGKCSGEFYFWRVQIRGKEYLLTFPIRITSGLQRYRLIDWYRYRHNYIDIFNNNIWWGYREILYDLMLSLC